MTERKFEITDARGGVAFGVRVVTKADATEIAGRGEDGTIKIRLMASPAGDPAANKELIDFIAAKLGVSPGKIEIVAGLDKKDKILSIEGLSPSEVDDKLVPES